jgi:hypothetical protein
MKQERVAGSAGSLKAYLITKHAENHRQSYDHSYLYLPASVRTTRLIVVCAAPQAG